MDKRISFFLLFFFISSFVAFYAFAGEKPRIIFQKTEHDFGEVHLGSGAVEYCFVFQNEGKEPLLIKDVRSSCGCVYGSWIKKPVAPGDSGSVCVVYKNNRSGVFRKTVKVISTAGKTTLHVKGSTVRKNKK
ncbi:MAG: DUF1573 domain-containing protein [Prevotellaceae bacterium]|jgi:hypothetical protein|nr:DUF1573 domain-containing protein [Prevotellaceae bacterium]